MPKSLSMELEVEGDSTCKEGITGKLSHALQATSKKKHGKHQEEEPASRLQSPAADTTKNNRHRSINWEPGRTGREQMLASQTLANCVNGENPGIVVQSILTGAQLPYELTCSLTLREGSKPRTIQRPSNFTIQTPWRCTTSHRRSRR